MDPQPENETTASCPTPSPSPTAPSPSPSPTASSPSPTAPSPSPTASSPSPSPSPTAPSPSPTASSPSPSPSPTASTSDTAAYFSAHARIFPEKVIFNILSRLPVKSILRFSYVSEQWRTLASREDFKSEHHIRSPSSLIIHTLQEPSPTSDGDPRHDIYTCSPPNPPLLLNYPGIDDDVVETHMLLIGSTTDGVVCISERENAEWQTLWNPDTGSYRLLPAPKLVPDPNIHSGVSVGLGYDLFEGQHIIVRIICHKDLHGASDLFEVHSLSSGEWTTVESDKIGQIRVLGGRCEAVIDDMPYWRAVENDVPVVASFDPEGLFFKVEEPLGWDMSEDSKFCIGGIKGRLGAVVWDEKEMQNGNQMLDVWMLNDANRWIRIHRVGPLKFIGRVLGLYGETGIVQDIGGGSLYVLDDPENFEDGEKVAKTFPTLARIWTVTYNPSLYQIPEAEDGST